MRLIPRVNLPNLRGLVGGATAEVRRRAMIVFDAIRPQDAAADIHESPQWLATALNAVAWIAAAGMLYFLLGLAFDTAGSSTSVLKIDAFLWMRFKTPLEWYFPKVIGYIILSVSVALLSVIWAAVFSVFTWRRHFWSKVISATLGLSASAFLIMGQIVINANTQVEEVSVKQESVSAEAAALKGLRDRLHRREDELARLQSGSSFQALAARAGPKRWQEKINATAPTDANYELIKRALTDANAAVDLKDEIDGLQAKIDATPDVDDVEKRTIEHTGGTQHFDFITAVQQNRTGLWAMISDAIAVVCPFLAVVFRKRRFELDDEDADDEAKRRRGRSIPHDRLVWKRLPELTPEQLKLLTEEEAAVAP